MAATYKGLLQQVSLALMAMQQEVQAQQAQGLAQPPASAAASGDADGRAPSASGSSGGSDSEASLRARAVVSELLDFFEAISRHSPRHIKRLMVTNLDTMAPVDSGWPVQAGLAQLAARAGAGAAERVRG